MSKATNYQVISGEKQVQIMYEDGSVSTYDIDSDLGAALNDIQNDES